MFVRRKKQSWSSSRLMQYLFGHCFGCFFLYNADDTCSSTLKTFYCGKTMYWCIPYVSLKENVVTISNCSNKLPLWKNQLPTQSSGPCLLFTQPVLNAPPVCSVRYPCLTVCKQTLFLLFSLELVHRSIHHSTEIVSCNRYFTFR